MPTASAPLGSDWDDDVVAALLAVEESAEERAVIAALDAADRAALRAVAEPAGPWTATERLAETARVGEVLTRKAQAATLRAVHALVAQVLADDRAACGAERSEAVEFAADEVAAALGVSRRVAEIRIADAAVLVADLPRTVAALEAGLISYPAARAMAAALRPVPEHDRALMAGEVESRVLDTIGKGSLDGLGRLSVPQILLTDALHPAQAWRVSLGLTTGRVSALARKAVADLTAGLAEPEPAPVVSDVEAWPVEPGWMFLGGRLREADGAIAMATIDSLARQLKTQPGETRSLGALRLEAYRLLLTSQPGTLVSTSTPSPDNPGRPDLPVPVPVVVRLTVDSAGCAATPRYGLLGTAALGELLTRATESGGSVTVRSIGRPVCPGNHATPTVDPHDPSPALDAAIRLRDRRCSFPGCGVPAGRCDLDHSVPHPRGPTCECNLACLCRHHHRLKTHGRWQLINHGHGHLTWITPTGRTIHTHPDP